MLTALAHKLHWAVIWRRVHGYFPYELFDRGLYLAGLMLLGYVVLPPSPASEDALTGPFSLAPPEVWGAVVAAVSLGCSLAAWMPAWRTRACVVLTVVAAYWASMLAVGIFLWDAPARAWVSVWIYAGVASQAYRLRARL